MDISNPTQPRTLGMYNTPGYVTDIAVQGDYAYVADKPEGLFIIDISDPITPTKVGFFGKFGSQIVVRDNYGYFLTPDGLLILDVSDLSVPTVISSYGKADDVFDQVTLINEYAYIGMLQLDVGIEGVKILDISDPTIPIEVGTYDIGPIQDAVLRNNQLYTLSGGLQILDLSSPLTPTNIGWYETSGFVQGIEIDGDYAYIAGTSNIQIVDISDPKAPVEVSFSKMGQARDVAVVDQYFYVVDDHEGLVIFEKPQ